MRVTGACDLFAGGAEAAGDGSSAGQPALLFAYALWPQAVRLVPPLVFAGSPPPLCRRHRYPLLELFC